MKVRISRSLLDRVMAQVQASPDHEICGLLLGEEGAVTAIQPAANIADDPTRHFEIDPTSLIAAHRAARCGGPGVIGHYHSHPSGDPTPSRRDAAMARSDGALWLLAGPSGAMKLWYAGDNGLHGRFLPADMIIDPSPC